jgi:hypothetical protein
LDAKRAHLADLVLIGDRRQHNHRHVLLVWCGADRLKNRDSVDMGELNIQQEGGRGGINAIFSRAAEPSGVCET